MVELTPDVQSFLDEKHLAVFVTLMKDGSPQATPTWVDHDGSHVLINTVQGHQKQRNLARDGRVTICVVDHVTPSRYVQVRGRVVSTEDGEAAAQHANKVSQKYSCRDYPGRTDNRVLVSIEPLHVNYAAGRGSGGGGSGWGRGASS